MSPLGTASHQAPGQGEGLSWLQQRQNDSKNNLCLKILELGGEGLDGAHQTVQCGNLIIETVQAEVTHAEMPFVHCFDLLCHFLKIGSQAYFVKEFGKILV